MAFTKSHCSFREELYEQCLILDICIVRLFIYILKKQKDVIDVS
jgi:hypothetical protein